VSASIEARLADNPFPGLRAFHTDEADVFFGRQRQVEELLALLDRVPLVAVSGASGCGKSSLVLAGVLRALELRAQSAADTTRWRTVTLRPGDAPIDNLARPLADVMHPAAAGAADGPRAAALAGRLRLGASALAEAVHAARLPTHERLLVVVDQFEELFRYRRITDADESAAFVKLLVHAAENPRSPVSVIITLRSDALGDCADFRNLPEAVSRGLFLVPRLTHDQRKQAIVGPVERRGFTIAPRLVQRVLNDVSDAFDDLPVMQHALSRTWVQWAGASAGTRAIDLADYDAVGGTAGALERHADQAYTSLAALQPVVERVFRALTERVTGPGSEVRRPLRFEQLCKVVGAGAEEVAAVVDRYRRADTSFLLPPESKPRDAGPIDISHESLIRGWPRLTAWADQEAQSAQMFRRLAVSAELHAQRREDLWRGAALQYALDWRRSQRPNADWASLYGRGYEQAIAFLEESKDARDAEAAASEWRRRRRAALVVAVVLGCLVVAAVMGWLWDRSAVAAAGLARKNADIAEQASSRRLAFEARKAHDEGRRDTALLLAAAALQRRPPAEEVQEIVRGLLADAPERYVARHEHPVHSMAFSSDGKRFASASAGGVVELWDVAAGRALARPRGSADANAPAAVGFDTEGRLLAAPDAAGRTVVGGTLGAIVATDGGANRQAVAFDAASALYAAADRGTEVQLYSVADGRLRGVLGAGVGSDDVVQLVFSPGGHRLAALLGSGAVLLWDRVGDAASARRPMRLAVGVGTTLAFSADGRLLATWVRDGGGVGTQGTLTLWDAVRGQALRRLRVFGAPPEVLAFSPDGRLLFAAAKDTRRLLRWDLTTGADRDEFLPEGSDGIVGLLVSPDGGMLAGGSSNGSIVLWDFAGNLRPRLIANAHVGQVAQLAFSPDGRTLASAGDDKQVVFWAVRPGGARFGPLRGDQASGNVAAVVLHPAGEHMAMASDDSFVQRFDIATGRTLPALGIDGPPKELSAVAYSSDGRYVAAAGEGGLVRLWDAQAGTAIDTPPLEGHEKRVAALAFSADGARLASADRAGRVIVWSLADRRPLKLPAVHQDEVTSLAFSADGRRLATASRDKTVRQWNLAAGTASEPLLTSSAEFTALVFLPGDRLVAASFDGEIRVVDTASSTVEAGRLHHRHVASLAVDRSGRWLVSGGDTFLKLWDMTSQTAVGQPFEGHREPVLGVAVSSDGRVAVSTDADKRVIVWDLDLAGWPSRACRIANREVRSDDWPRALREEFAKQTVCAGTVQAAGEPRR